MPSPPRITPLRSEEVRPPLTLLYNVESEQVVLGGVLISNALYPKLAAFLQPEHFGNAVHGRIWSAVGQVIKGGGTATPVTLKNLFDQDGALVDIGGAQYLARLAGASVADRALAEDHARVVHQLYLRRALIMLGDDLVNDAYKIDDFDRPVPCILDEHAARLALLVKNSFSVATLPATKISDWLRREIDPPDLMLGELLSTTTRMMVIGPTGAGKTNFLLAVAFAAAAGGTFLRWAGGGPPRKVLFLDGEMSSRQMKRRIEGAERRARGVPDGLHVLCRDDAPEMEPLDTAAGQRFVDKVIERIGGIDLFIADNIQALQTDDEAFGAQSWQRTLPWIRSLTRRSIGQIWAHHCVPDSNHGYGSRTREWALDVVALMETIERHGCDIAFNLRFTKARERTPENRADFEAGVVMLSDDEWKWERGGDRPNVKKPRTDLALDILNDEIARGHGTIPPADEHIPPDTLCITSAAWRKAYELRDLSANREAAERAFYRAVFDLTKKSKLVAKYGSWVWPVR
jgi:hypothetical protein